MALSCRVPPPTHSSEELPSCEELWGTPTAWGNLLGAPAIRGRQGMGGAAGGPCCPWAVGGSLNPSSPHSGWELQSTPTMSGGGGTLLFLQAAGGGPARTAPSRMWAEVMEVFGRHGFHNFHDLRDKNRRLNHGRVGGGRG